MKDFEDALSRIALLCGPPLVNWAEFEGKYLWTTVFVSFALFTLYSVASQAVGLLQLIHKRLFPEHNRRD